MNSIHGHEVMHLIADANRSFTRAQLLETIDEQFGSEARFHTCSAHNMTAADLLEFLIARGKFADSDPAALRIDPGSICQH